MATVTVAVKTNGGAQPLLSTLLHTSHIYYFQGRWLHLFQLVEKQYQEQILAQQEQYQCQIQVSQPTGKRRRAVP